MSESTSLEVDAFQLSAQQDIFFPGAGDDQCKQLGKDVEHEQGWRGIHDGTRDVSETGARSHSTALRSSPEPQVQQREASMDMGLGEVPYTQQLEPDVLVGDSLWDLSAESTEALSADDAMSAFPWLFDISTLSMRLLQGSCSRRPPWDATEVCMGTK